MTKHARKSRRYQPVERPPAATVQIPLPVLGAFAGIARSYVEVCIRAGQQVLDAMMEQDRTEVCGPRWKRDPERRAGRAGTTSSAVTVGGRRSRMTRPRVRSQTGEEVEVPSVACASHRDPLDAQTVNAVACGISTRTYARRLEPLPEAVTERATSMSAVSRRDVALTTTPLTRWLTTPLGDRQFPIVLIDGIVLGDHTVVIALGVDTEGKTQSLGLREGHTEHSRVAKALLRDLVDRGLVPDRARLCVIDGVRLGPPRGVRRLVLRSDGISNWHAYRHAVHSLMIRRFRHRGLKRMYERSDPSRVGPDLADRIALALADIDDARKPSDLDLPGYRLHLLKGRLKGYWSISISGNWRVIFRFEDGDAYDVDLIDYH